ncbi:MAG TPA: hypothetical protein VF092_28580 [Longimicrobium sp.]
MHIRRTLTALAAVLCAGALASCSDSPSGPDERPGNELVFIRAAGDAPPLERDHVQFWARVNETRDVEIRYSNVSPEYGGDECLEFKVPNNALWKKPDGSLFQPGDSVLISIRVTDLNHFIFEFQPAGLQFHPDHPAELRVSYKWADPDINGDGVVDDRDRLRFGFWRQEADGLPWKRVGSTRDSNLQELRADIFGFTKYALAAD